MNKYYKEFKEMPFESFVSFIEREKAKEIFYELDDTLDTYKRISLKYYEELKKKHLGSE